MTESQSDTKRDIARLKLSKSQIEVLYEARRWRGELPGPMVETNCGNALVRKGLMWHVVFIQDVWRLTPEGERVAALIIKDAKVVPLRRSA